MNKIEKVKKWAPDPVVCRQAAHGAAVCTEKVEPKNELA